MGIAGSFRVALRALAGNKMRTALTMLGIIIGVAVVILVVGIGAGATKRVTDAVNSLGTNLLTVRPGRPRVRLTAASRSTTDINAIPGVTPATTPSSNSQNRQRLNLEDARLIAERFPKTVAAVAPQSQGNVQVRLNGRDANTSLIGATPAYAYVNNTDADRGRFLLDHDVESSARICLVGQTLANNLTDSPGVNLVGQTLTINKQEYTVVGMLAPKGSGAYGQDQDDVVMVPISTAMRRVLNRPYIDLLGVRCVNKEMMPLAQEQISAFLRNRHNLRPPFPENDDFRITSQTELMERQQSVTDTMTSLLSAVAVVSLVVGGLGIMNIMLVSVTERTREIGIRKAIGATPQDILLQFLLEAAVISLLGGLIGIAAGIGGAHLLSGLAGWDTLIDHKAVVTAVVVSAAVGIFFGIYPARKASAMRPIDALRFE